jgi:hypothetical protein
MTAKKKQLVIITVATNNSAEKQSLGRMTF